MKIVILEKQEFARLVNQHRKALYIIEFLTFITEQEKPLERYYDADDLCKIFGITRSELSKAYFDNRINGLSANGRLLYIASEIIELKCLLEREKFAKILRQIAQDESILCDSARRPASGDSPSS